MNLLLVNKYHFTKGGAERYYLDLGARLSRNGHPVTYLSMRSASNIPAGPDDRFVSEVDYRAPAGKWGRIRQALRTIHNDEATAAVHEIAARKRPSVAHLHNIYHQLSPSVIRALDAEGIAMVQTLHDYKLVCPAYLLLTQGEVCERCRGGRYYEAVRRRCLLDSRAASVVGMAEAYWHRWLGTYEKVRLFLCPSRFMLEKMRSFGVEESRLVHLPYFIPAESYRPRERGSAYYVYAGRLSREKGIETLLEAHARLPKSRIPLRILGDGPIRGRLEKRRAELGLDDVAFEGYQEAERLHEIVAGALFVAVPSEWYENFPYAILEAFALERPVVGTAIGGIPEMVREGETGRIVPPGNPDALADGLARLIVDPSTADAMGKRARAWVEETLAPDDHLDRLTAIYTEVAG